MTPFLQDMIGGKAASLDPAAFLVHDQWLLMVAETLVLVVFCYLTPSSTTQGTMC